jgi:hypothetical protein
MKTVSDTSPRASIADPAAPSEGGGTQTLDRELEELLNKEAIEPGDHERFSHYVKKEKILESALSGKPVRALCGKKWLPGRDPEKFPVCPACKAVYEKMKSE